MDGSGSIKRSNFNKEKQFVVSLIKNLDLNETRVSVMTFSTFTNTLFYLNSFKNISNIENLVTNAEYDADGTNTGLALNLADTEIMQEYRGMRNENLGIPRIIMVITDGESNDKTLTFNNSQIIKNRGINIISVGIGNLNPKELNDIASSKSDVYKVEDFDKIVLILASLSRTVCLKPAKISPEQSISSLVTKNTYKYFKLSLMKNNMTYLNKFSIELNTLSGKTDLVYSFIDENPKFDSDYIQLTNKPSSNSGNFIEKPKSVSISKQSSQLVKDKATTGNNANYFQVTRPSTGQNEILYIGIKGYSDVNRFQVYVHDKVVTPDTVISQSGRVCFSFINYLFSILVFILI